MKNLHQNTHRVINTLLLVMLVPVLTGCGLGFLGGLGSLLGGLALAGGIAAAGSGGGGGGGSSSSGGQIQKLLSQTGTGDPIGGNGFQELVANGGDPVLGNVPPDILNSIANGGDVATITNPEPATMLLMGGGIATMAYLQNKKRKSQKL